MRLSAIAALLTLLAAPLAAQDESPPPEFQLAPTYQPTMRQYETRLAPEGHVPPPATLDQMDWLVGHWDDTSTGVLGAPLMESWSQPAGDTMVGTVVERTWKGGIRVVEHLYLTEEEGTLVLRQERVNSDLTGRSEKDGMFTFRLVAIEPCAAFFEGFTLRCQVPEAPSFGLVTVVRRSNGTERRFRFDRSNGYQPKRCPEAPRSAAENPCLRDRYRRADETRARYLAAALSRFENHRTLPRMIAESDAAFIAYRDAECAADGEWYQHFEEEDRAIGADIELACAIELIDQRTRQIWQNYLIYEEDLDEYQPILPEPRLTR